MKTNFKFCSCCARDVLPPTHPVFFAFSYFCNNVVYGALLGWARRNLRFTHKLARFIHYHLARWKCGDKHRFWRRSLGFASPQRMLPVLSHSAKHTHSLTCDLLGEQSRPVVPLLLAALATRPSRPVQHSIIIHLSQCTMV